MTNPVWTQKLEDILNIETDKEALRSNIEQNRLNNSRTYWKSLKCLMGNYKQLDSIPILKQTVNNVDDFYFTDEEKANCLNNHFSSVSELDDSNSQLPQFDLETHSELSNIEIQ